ncbi:T9SS type A sorting domain-containing protein [Chitinophagaceae bacterium MMS25-I14]
MKMKFLKIGMLATLLCGSFYEGKAQMSQFQISNPNRSSLVTKVRKLADGSAVLGGYIYDISNGAVTNADMILLRVDVSGNILWQKQFGTSQSAANDLLHGMTIAQNGDIIVVGTVGRNSAYDNNTAAIFRFDQNGNLLWQNFVRKTNSSYTAGDNFNDVAELSNGNIIAVGGDDYAPGSSKSLIAYFTSTGSLTYTQYYDRPGSDEFLGVCANGTNAIITGWFDGNSYKDSRILSYQPNPTAGTGSVLWDHSYNLGQTDMNGNSLTCDGLSRVFNTGQKIIAEGSVSQTYSASPNVEVYFECDLNGANPDFRTLRNLEPYANNTGFYPVDQNHYFVAQNPGNTLADVNLWTTASSFNAVISEVHPFQLTGQVVQDREFNEPGNQSIFDITMDNSVGTGNGNLYMAGCTSTSSSSSSIHNDIYFVISSTNLSNPNQTCPLNDNTVEVLDPTVANVTRTDAVSVFSNNNVFQIDYTTPALKSALICGEPIVTQDPCGIKSMSICTDPLVAPNDYTFTPVITPVTASIDLDFGDGTPHYTGPGNISITHHYSTPLSGPVVLVVFDNTGAVCTKKAFNMCVYIDPNSGDPTVDNPKSKAVNTNLMKVADPYPNPTHSVLNVPAYIAKGAVIVSVVDVQGVVLVTKTAPSVEGNITIPVNTENLKPGVYFINITDGRGKTVKIFTKL